jgi:hypothetical protein
MHKAKAFLFVCAGLFLLVLSYHLGARNAVAQSGAQANGLAISQNGCGTTEVFVITPSGDMYRRGYSCGQLNSTSGFIGNFWSGTAPTAVQNQSWGSVKKAYR